MASTNTDSRALTTTLILTLNKGTNKGTMKALKIRAKGVLRLKITNLKTGEVTTDVGNNTVTDLFVARLVDGLTTAPPPNDIILKIGVGEGDTEASMEDTSLTNAFIKNLSDLDTTTPGTIRCQFTIQSGDANGLVITEYGLLTSSEVLMARRTRPALTKTSDIVIEGEWTITFTTA